MAGSVCALLLYGKSDLLPLRVIFGVHRIIQWRLQNRLRKKLPDLSISVLLWSYFRVSVRVVLSLINFIITTLSLYFYVKHQSAVRWPTSLYVSFAIVCVGVYKSVCIGVERTRVQPGPTSTVLSDRHLFSARSAVVRRCYGARHHSRPQPHHWVWCQGSRRQAADAWCTVSSRRSQLPCCIWKE